MNVNLLRSKMMLKGHRDKDLAEVLRITQASISSKMNMITTFDQREISKIVHYYELTPNETHSIFFEGECEA